MKRPVSYNTRQRKAILDYIISLGGEHVTASQISDHFKDKALIGRTTIYRHLEKLTESGKVRKFMTEVNSGACFQYVGGNENSEAQLHLKCEECGELLHLDCNVLHELEQDVFNKHAFQVNSLKTVLYGKCVECLKKV